MKHVVPEKDAQAAERRRKQRPIAHLKEEKNRQKATGGGRPNEAGVTQGQNAEQGNTIRPEQSVHHGDATH